MWCPRCGARSQVIGTITNDIVKRFRKCCACGYSWQTIEAIEDDEYWREYKRITLDNNKTLFDFDYDDEAKNER
jgi:transcriptional repressor NrdR